MGRASTRTLHETLRLRRQARASRFPELDRLKEEVANLKFWQGVAVVTLISVAGWLITNGAGTPVWTFVLAAAGVIFLAIGTIVLILRIKQRIERIGRL
ncbi:MAG: hypothetical protein E6H54_05735 [Betaproteobacteria bacterium]|nr:MAG: hypothetical protein E6H54_05735 [Betaproteobacteria bacterium]